MPPFYTPVTVWDVQRQPPISHSSLGFGSWLAGAVDATSSSIMIVIGEITAGESHGCNLVVGRLADDHRYGLDGSQHIIMMEDSVEAQACEKYKL